MNIDLLFTNSFIIGHNNIVLLCNFSQLVFPAN